MMTFGKDDWRQKVVIEIARLAITMGILKIQCWVITCLFLSFLPSSTSQTFHMFQRKYLRVDDLVTNISVFPLCHE